MVKHISEPSEVPQSGCVVIDFFATWCGPCKYVAPKFEEMSKLYTSVTFLKVDVDESEDLVNLHTIRAMPTFVFLKDGVVVDRIEGADIRGIGDILERLTK